MVSLSSIRTLIKDRQNVRRVKKSVRGLVKASGKRFAAHSKRVAVQYRINRIRKFDGKKYYLTEFVTNGDQADKLVRSEREDGVPTRCVTVNDGYAIYVRRSG